MVVAISANKDSDLLTKNIETLADGESGGCGFFTNMMTTDMKTTGSSDAAETVSGCKGHNPSIPTVKQPFSNFRQEFSFLKFHLSY